MPHTSEVTDIARVIQLAVAPVFLLTAIGTILSVLSGRLARIVDRARVLVERASRATPDGRSSIQAEIEVLLRRRRLVNLAITSGTTAALLVCVLIASAFVGYLVGANFSTFLAVLFIAAMGAFVVALVLFLREILMAVAMIRLEAPWSP
jgi:multidrug efflux pump subunit AcrB